MSFNLREQLRISSAASMEETARICNEYYAIYKNIYETSPDPLVRDMARERISALEKAAAAESVYLSYSPADTSAAVTDIPTEIYRFLSDLHSDISRSEYDRQIAVLRSMPDCAEKHYLQGCLLLAMGGLSPALAKEAAACFAEAVRKDRDNSAYGEVNRAFQDETAKYNTELEAWRAAVKQKEAEAEIQRINMARQEKIKSVLKGAGKVILAVAGAIAAAAGVLFSCFCECADGC